jgi:hypothetical protein
MCIFTGKPKLNSTFAREQLQRNARENVFMLRISMDHLQNFDEQLSQQLRK